MSAIRLAIDVRLDYRLPEPADLLLAVEVAPMADQRLIEDRLTAWGVDPMVPVPGIDGIGRRTFLHAETGMAVHYTALVEVERPPVRLAGLPVDPLAGLPGDVVPYLFPSRYCESDRFEAAVKREFGHVVGGDKVQAIADWIHAHLDYRAGTSQGTTTAADTFVAHQGVCRDYAHLLIAMVRAADIPARMVGAYGLGVSPPDFHAVAEVWLAGGWHLVDATRMTEPEGIVRVGVGRDATDVAFLTIFGSAQMASQTVSVTRV